MELWLTTPESDALAESLEGELSRLLMEIANTDDRKMKEGLREREGTIRSILERVKIGLRGAA